VRRKPSAICKFVTRKFPRVWIQVEVFASLQQCKDFIPFTIVENNEVWKTKAIRQYVLVCELLASASYVPAFEYVNLWKRCGSNKNSTRGKLHCNVALVIFSYV